MVLPGNLVSLQEGRVVTSLFGQRSFLDQASLLWQYFFLLVPPDFPDVVKGITILSGGRNKPTWVAFFYSSRDQEMLGLGHFPLVNSSQRTPCHYPLSQVWDPKPVKLPFVTFQSSLLFASHIIPRIYSCILYGRAGRDVSTLSCLDQKSEYMF